eukprot:TRINITY_DN1863_c0_g1_i1.p1 TRINITY_DN1863_c0_g1~~TRINITY_DN1863_c0_g1_i1.p1  ORF type:complete len:189 (+),score=32.56 TRINITY_DN1863_c0_g1_i1:49-615(+)
MSKLPPASVTIRRALPEDLEQLYVVINDAYRKPGGWTGEHNLLIGDRVFKEEIEEMITDSKLNFMVAEQTSSSENEPKKILGCVLVKPFQEYKDEMEIGCFSVSPKAQGGGVGSLLIKEALKACVALSAKRAVMTVVHCRPELIEWYNRLGFVATGERIDFPFGDRFKSVDKAVDIYFVVLKKELESL